MKILLIDDHALFRAGMKYVLQDLSSSLTLLEAGSCDEASEILLNSTDLDLILLDLKMPGTSGSVCISQVCSLANDTPVVILTADGRNTSIQQACQYKIWGYIQKSHDPGTMIPTLKQVLNGEPQLPRIDSSAHSPESLLTTRQSEILSLIVQGKSNQQIADTLAITEGTTRIHVTNILKTLGVRSRSEAIYKVSNRDGDLI